MSAIARLRAVVLDCPEPRALAEFYRALAGGEITYADDDWVNLRDGGNVILSFQRASNYQAPRLAQRAARTAVPHRRDRR